jgi:hypothetical protein
MSLKSLAATKMNNSTADYWLGVMDRDQDQDYGKLPRHVLPKS